MLDELTSGRDPLAQRWPRRVATVLVLLGVLGYGGDRLLAQREQTGLLARAAAAQETAIYADRRVSAALTYASPQLSSPAVSPGVRRSLQRLVEDTARGQLTALRTARRRAAAERVLPWHSRLRAARRAYLTYLDARIAYLSSVARDIGSLFQSHAELPSLLALATAAFRRAFGPGSDQRIRAALG